MFSARNVNVYFHNLINRTSVYHLKGTKELGVGGKAVVSSSLVKLMRRGPGTLVRPWGGGNLSVFGSALRSDFAYTVAPSGPL